jgi:hypothetical protein
MGFPPKFCMHSSSPPYVPCALFITSSPISISCTVPTQCSAFCYCSRAIWNSPTVAQAINKLTADVSFTWGDKQLDYFYFVTSTAIKLNVSNYNALLGPKITSEEKRNVSIDPNFSRVSAEPPAVRKDFCPSALVLLSSHSSCDSFLTNCKNRIFGNLEI